MIDRYVGILVKKAIFGSYSFCLIDRYINRYIDRYISKYKLIER